jgi:hypothetical protein
MTFARVVLVFGALVFLGFGGWLLVEPGALARFVRVDTTDPITRTEIRAFYGGLELGLGLFLLVGAFIRRWIAPALVATILAFGATAAGRALGLILDRPTVPTVLLFLLVEVAFAILGAAALARFVTQHPPPISGAADTTWAKAGDA